jgi:tRNA (guanine-N7-)-methyltransferase
LFHDFPDSQANPKPLANLFPAHSYTARMRANSRSITSSQTGVHERLATVVARHAAMPFRKPIAGYSRRAFDLALVAWRDAGEPPLILDGGCGVGLSTRHMAIEFPDHFVIGVDQSADRLAREVRWQEDLPCNFLLLRADLADVWRLLDDAGIRLARHYLLYPNPWPKPGQLQRRWHGHPVFPTAVALGGAFECRSNWRIYVEECAAALTQLTGILATCEPYSPARILTPFEAKYLDSGHALWRCTASLPARAGKDPAPEHPYGNR